MEIKGSTIVRLVESCPTKEFSVEKVSEIARLAGFDHLSYTLHLPIPISSPRIYNVNNFPEYWNNLYIEKGYQSIDITQIHAKKSNDPLIWCRECFSSCPTLWHDYSKLNLQFSVTKSVFDAGKIIGVITLASYLNPSSDRLKLLKGVGQSCLEIHRHYAKRICPELTELHAILSRRESEVLKHTADGKTSNEIAELLSISERTVKFHIESTSSKLKTKNKTAAVAMALLFGLI